MKIHTRDLDKELKEYYSPDWKRGFKAGQEHSEPSQATKDFIEKQKDDNQKQQIIIMNIENNINNIFKQLQEIPTKKDVELSNGKLLKEVFCNIEEKMKEHELKSDEKYAIKEVEKAVAKISENITWAIKVVVGLVITAIVSFFLIR